MTFKEAVSVVRVAVAAGDYPSRLLNRDELEELQAEVVKAMRFIPDTQEVCFHRCSFKPGYLVLHCANRESADWLVGIVPSLKIWEGVSFRTMEGKEIPTPYRVSTFVPVERGHQIPEGEVLSRLAVSNRCLNTRLWSTLGKTQQEKGTYWIWSVDQGSLEGLRSRDMNPFFAAGRIKFYIRPAEEKRLVRGRPTASPGMTSEGDTSATDSEAVDGVRTAAGEARPSKEQSTRSNRPGSSGHASGEGDRQRGATTEKGVAGDKPTPAAATKTDARDA